VIQGRENLRFALEPRHAIDVERELRREDLDRDFAVQLGIARAKHFAHAAGAERRHDLIWAEAGACCQRHGLVVVSLQSSIGEKTSYELSRVPAPTVHGAC